MFLPTKMVDIELSRPITAIENLKDYGFVKALVRLHGVPLGYVQLPVSNGRCLANGLIKIILEQHSWAIIRHLVGDGLATLKVDDLEIADLVNIPHPAYNGPFPLVTVAVCTRNRTASLKICLDALNKLDYPNLEILVIDNAPNDDTTERLVKENYRNVRYIYEPRPGLNWARNRAVAEAHGEIIAYTDDDVIVDPGWTRAIVQTFVENPEVMALTGLVVPYELETKTQVLFEEYGGFGRGFERRWYRVNREGGQLVASEHGWAGKFGTGANMSFRRSLFNNIGLFDPALDVGTATNGGGDIEMFFRVLHEGYTIVYEPNALVRHRHRRDYESLYKQIANNGIGFSAYLVQSALNYPDERFAIVLFWLTWLKWWHLPRLIRSLRGKETFPRDLILAEFRGYLVGLGRYAQAQRRAAKIAKEASLDNVSISTMEFTIQ